MPEVESEMTHRVRVLRGQNAWLRARQKYWEGTRDVAQAHGYPTAQSLAEARLRSIGHEIREVQLKLYRLGALPIRVSRVCPPRPPYRPICSTLPRHLL